MGQRIIQVGDEPDEGRFARAVRPQDGGMLALPDAHGDAVQHPGVVFDHRGVVNFQQWGPALGGAILMSGW